MKWNWRRILKEFGRFLEAMGLTSIFMVAVLGIFVVEGKVLPAAATLDELRLRLIAFVFLAGFLYVCYLYVKQLWRLLGNPQIRFKR